MTDWREPIGVPRWLVWLIGVAMIIHAINGLTIVAGWLW